MSTWYSVATSDETDRLLGAWPGAPVEGEEVAGMLLDIARGQVLAYAPSDDHAAQVTELLQDLEVEEEAIASVLALLDFEATVPDPPVRYVYAQLQQAKNLWAAGMADENGSIGTEGYSFVPRPLDKTIRAIIRPTSGAIDVF